MSRLALLRNLVSQRQNLLPTNFTRLRCAAAMHWSPHLRQEASRGLCFDFPMGFVHNIQYIYHADGGGSLQRSQDNTQVSTDVRPIGEKIKENTKTASYTAIIIAGLGVTCVMFFAIFQLEKISGGAEQGGAPLISFSADGLSALTAGSGQFGAILPPLPQTSHAQCPRPAYQHSCGDGGDQEVQK